MKIGILGSGLMGSALGNKWAQAGHHILFAYSRSMAKLQELAHSIGNHANAVSVLEAVTQADVLLIAVPWHRVSDLISQTGPLTNRIILTCMLPMTEDDSDLALGFTTSGAEELARLSDGRVVGTFNTVWSNVIAQQSDEPRSMFYVGDNEDAKQTAAILIRDAGFDPIDAGALSEARLLEPFGLLMGKLGFAYDPLVAYRFLQLPK